MWGWGGFSMILADKLKGIESKVESFPAHGTMFITSEQPITLIAGTDFPSNVEITIAFCGGGGSGGATFNTATTTRAGGGYAGEVVTFLKTYSNGDTLPISLGIGGSPVRAWSAPVSGKAGVDSIVDGITAKGGAGGSGTSGYLYRGLGNIRTTALGSDYDGATYGNSASGGQSSGAGHGGVGGEGSPGGGTNGSGGGASAVYKGVYSGGGGTGVALLTW